MYKPSALLSFLQSEQLNPLKQLSQNFLIDGNIIKKILHVADIREGDEVVEIGPGPGALTEALLNKGAKVTAIELDKKFALLLNRLQRGDQKLQVFHEDALKIPLSKLPDHHVKLLSNLPYHLTTPLMTRFLPLFPQLQSLTVMVQKEVAERIIKGSSLSLYVRLFSNPKYCFDIPPTCFFPVPRITSTLMHFPLHSPLPDINPVGFEKLVRTCFLKRRKMLRVSLAGICTARELEQLNLNPEARPESLSMEQFLTLYRYTARA